MKKFKAENLKYYGLSLLALVIFFVLWFVYAGTEKAAISSPVEVLQRFVEVLHNPVAGASLGEHILASLQRVLIGFLVAAVIGILLGICFGWFETFRDIVEPVFSIIRPIPPIAWIPLVILWAGIGEKAKIIIVFIACVMPIVLNTKAGVEAAEPLLLDAGKILGANNRQMLLSVALPDAIPTIIAGLKNALSTGWMAVVGAEMVVARKGVGFLIISGMENLDISLVMVSIVIIAIISSCLTFILNHVEGVLCPWLKLENK